MAAIKITKPRGVMDVLPSDVGALQAIEAAAKETARLFGFSEIRFPTFEHTELFLRGVGETTDIVGKEMYTFTDKGGRSLTLRPEGTASVVRAFIENALHQGGLPLKVFYIAPNFRYEKPQAGRLREHHQFGVECFGSALAEADVEIIALAAEYLRLNGVKNVALHLNSIGCPDCRAGYNTLLRDYFSSHIDTLCDTCKTRLARNPLRILDCKSPICGELKKNAPTPCDHLCDDCAAHFEGVKKGLDLHGIPYTQDKLLVRGLDYYTRTVFEFISSDIGAQGTVLAGGRYDRLVEELGGVSTPALGFGSGIERLLLQKQAEGIRDADASQAAVFLAAAGDEARDFCATLAASLRHVGCASWHDISGRKLKAQMKNASGSVPFTIVIGEDEISSGRAKLRDMRSGEEREISLDAADIAKFVYEAY